jgi:hypothetical protein
MQTADTPVLARPRHARDSLANAGVLDAAKGTRITARVPEKLLEAAHYRAPAPCPNPGFNFGRSSS